ncbi:hypothetical protein FRC03_004784 [Tulasnella sp. 419]|nr:hypothetical protein FRC03_004784 [Tulasnella sp. 419]
MRPEWFRLLPDATGPSSQLPPVPFDKMWKDDYLWWPMLLKKQRFIGRVDFGLPTNPEDWNSANLLKWWFGALE